MNEFAPIKSTKLPTITIHLKILKKLLEKNDPWKN